MADPTVCGSCGIPLSWPDVYRCGRGHGDRIPDDDTLVERRDMEDLFGASQVTVSLYTRDESFPEPFTWRRGKGRGGWIPRWKLIEVKAWGFRRGHYTEDD